jgi:tetratricopeptide (TPR) repeat protein
MARIKNRTRAKPPSPPDEKINISIEKEQALTAARGGNLSKALKLIDDSLRRYPDSAVLYSIRSGIHFQVISQISHDDSAVQVEHLETALDANRRAVQLAPNSICFAHYHAVLLFHLAKNDAALEYDYNDVIQACEQALLLENPTDPLEDLLDVERMYANPSPAFRIERVKKKLLNLLEESKENTMKVFKKLKKSTNNTMNFQDIKQTAEDGCSYSDRDLYTERSSTPISILQTFDQCSVYNSCFPPIQILDWFSHSSNEPQVAIGLPPRFHNYKDGRWMGLALCASFSVCENSTATHENLEQETCHYLTCCLDTAIDSIEPYHVYRPTGEDVELLYLGGFMWLSYIPRISLPLWLNQCTSITASIFTDSPSLTVQNCGIRLIYPHDEVEFKEAIRHCVASLSDSEDLVRQIAVDIRRQRNKKIYDDETMPSRMGGSVDHRLKDKGKRVIE